MKRFWSEVSVDCQDNGFVILLDGRPMRLPGGPRLLLRQKKLAEAIAEEWRTAGQVMSAADVPLTGLAGAAQAVERDGVVAAIAAYGASDLICYRAERPAGLVVRQAMEWGPWVAWAGQRLGARLRVTEGVMPVAQEAEALSALRGAVACFDAFGLAGLGVMVPALGSLVFGLAVAGGALEAGEACRLAALDEVFEEEAWGADCERVTRRAAVARDVGIAARFMVLALASED